MKFSTAGGWAFIAVGKAETVEEAEADDDHDSQFSRYLVKETNTELPLSIPQSWWRTKVCKMWLFVYQGSN